MKKFTRFAAAGLAISAGLTLAACHPPSEQDSDEKVDTAATFEGEAPGAGASEEVATETVTEVAPAIATETETY